MKMDGSIMRMRQLPGIDLPAGGAVALQPGGNHIMLIGLKAPLKEGDKFPLTLTFAKSGKVEVEVIVEKPGAPARHGH
jgi:copper(I)-binding protein